MQGRRGSRQDGDLKNAECERCDAQGERLRMEWRAVQLPSNDAAHVFASRGTTIARKIIRVPQLSANRRVIPYQRHFISSSLIKLHLSCSQFWLAFS